MNIMISPHPFLTRSFEHKGMGEHPVHYGGIKVYEDLKRSMSENHDDRKSKPPEDIVPKQEISSKDAALFKIMRLEINRLNSYTGKWPLHYVKPVDLAVNGFFYLQTEDRVQCAFCHVVVDDWNVGQKPRRQHMIKSPKCPFLLHSNVDNVPLPPQVPLERASKVNIVGKRSEVNFSAYKPKHPKMADIKRRLMTYKEWPLIMLSSQQLAKCGLYYTGVGDVVTCFFCGGSLCNWDITDDPFKEHTKFFPHCSYLNLIKGQRPSPPSVQMAQMAQARQSGAMSVAAASSSLADEIIQQAGDIFSAQLVQKVVSKHVKETDSQFHSLNDLCDAILEYTESSQRAHDVTGHKDAVCTDPQVEKAKETKISTMVTNEEESNVKITKEIKDVLLCKICMDREMGVVFQPCGHLVSCPKCAHVIFTCPLCRTSITSKVRTYLS